MNFLIKYPTVWLWMQCVWTCCWLVIAIFARQRKCHSSVDGLLSFDKAETLSPISSLITNVKGYVSQQKYIPKMFTENFYSMMLDWKCLKKCPKLQQGNKTAGCGLWDDTLKWSAHCNVCLSWEMFVKYQRCNCMKGWCKVTVTLTLLWLLLWLNVC